MRYLSILILLLITCSPGLYGQESEVSDNYGRLDLRIKSISFIKNNEYFNPISPSKLILTSALPARIDKSLWTEGYTLPGFFLQPELLYSPSSRVSLRAGAHLLKYSGTDNFSHARPVFSAILNFSENTSLTIGTLRGSDTHGLFDPHFNSERTYNAYAEDGFQFTTHSEHVFNDTWLSWENFIFKGDYEREIFTFGESFTYTSVPIAGFITVDIPFQLQFKHFGGQITNYLEPVETFFNLATGIKINFSPAQKRFGSAGLEYLYFKNSVFPEKEYRTISAGSASWFRFHYEYKALRIISGYWRAHDYYAPNGNPMFASIVEFNSDYAFRERRILSNSAFLRVMPESYFELLFGIETYYDLCRDHLDHSITLHLNFDNLVRLASFKK